MSLAEPVAPGTVLAARPVAVGAAFGVEIHAPRDLPLMAPREARGGRAGTRRTSIEVLAAAELERRWTGSTAERVLERRFRDGRLVMSVDRDPAGRFRVYAPRNGRHLVSPDGADILSALPRIAPWRWQRLLFAQVLPLAATLRGLELLHASAVELDGRILAFVARAGTGKTSVATHLVAGGAALVTDDVLAVEPVGGRLVGYPGAPTFNVAREELLRVPPERRPRLGRRLGEADKLVLSARLVDGPRPLGALFFLARPSGDRIRIERVEPDPIRLLANSFNLYVRTPARLENQLETVARLTETVPLFSVAVPAGAGAPAVASAIAAHGGDAS
ncbi:MAG TPA: hypothetical protein VGF10_04315 [Gaiella sp.]